MTRRSLAALAAVLVVCACATKPVTLGYTPPAGLRAASGVAASIGRVEDARGNDSHWIGSIRGGFGNPLKELKTEKPVSDVVADVLTQGLEARRMAAATPVHRLDVRMVRFDCSQLVRREAHVELAVSVVDVATGRSVYSRTVKVDRVDGSLLALKTGVLADVEDLRALANAALQEAVDQLLDDPALRETIA